MSASLEAVNLRDDLVIGADAVACFLGMTKRQVYGCMERRHMPLFKIGAQICARRSVVLAWIQAREMATMASLAGEEHT